MLGVQVAGCCGLAEAGPCLAPVLGARTLIAPKKLQYEMLV